MKTLRAIVLPVLLGATVAACAVRTERTVYTPAPAPVAVAPAPVVYYPSTASYYEPYHPAYYSY